MEKRFWIFSYDEIPGFGIARWHFTDEYYLGNIPYRTWNVVFLDYVITDKYAFKFQNMIERKFNKFKEHIPSIFEVRNYAEDFLKTVPDDCKRKSDKPRMLQKYTLARYINEL